MEDGRWKMEATTLHPFEEMEDAKTRSAKRRAQSAERRSTPVYERQVAPWRMHANVQFDYTSSISSCTSRSLLSPSLFISSHLLSSLFFFPLPLPSSLLRFALVRHNNRIPGLKHQILAEIVAGNDFLIIDGKTLLFPLFLADQEDLALVGPLGKPPGQRNNL